MNIKEVDILDRIEEARDKNIDKVKIYDLEELEYVFDEQITLINRNLTLACGEYNKNNKDIHDSINCSQIVLIESFFDYFCHSVLIYGIKQMYDGNWPKTDKYNNILIPLAIVSEEDYSFDDIANYLSQKNSTETFLNSDKFVDTFKLLNPNIIKDLSDEMYSTLYEHERVKELKKTLSEIYNLRNKIVHQACKDRITGLTINISRNEVTDYIKVVKIIISSLIRIIKKY